MALDQLDKLTQNQDAWESYEEERNTVSETLVVGETEFANIEKVSKHRFKFIFKLAI